MINSKRSLLYTALMMALAAQSAAQPDPAGGGSKDTVLEEVVVTGTLIRGIAPTGASVVTMSEDDILATGAMTANQALSSIPQVTSNFNNVRALPGGGALNLTPRLRDFGPSAAATTLVLMDGHRLINAGLLSTSPDPDVLPPAVLSRVDVITDGGSSIYGSDAVGGVINFITRKNIEGVEVATSYGVADSYNSLDFNLSAGHGWNSGSAYISYAYTGNNDIEGSDRGFMRQVTVNGGQCGAGTVFNGSTSYALPNLVPGTITDCDITDKASFYPKVTLETVFGGFTQDLTDGIALDLKAFYSERKSTSHADPNSDDTGGGGQTAVICSPELGAACGRYGGVVYPGYMPVADDSGVQTVKFNYSGLLDTEQRNKLKSYQIIPTLTFDLVGSWQLQTLASYGKSDNDTFLQLVNAAAQPSLIASGVLNPYDPRTADPNGPVTGAFSNFIGSGSQELVNARMIADGDLMDIRAGTISLALGVEYTKESLNNVIYATFPYGTGTSGANPIDADRDINAVFGEVVVPIISGANAIKAVQELTLSLSARYDDYSDFGSTTNPKIGIDYSPVEWVTFGGNWGKSFVAPSLADTNAPDTRSFTVPALAAPAPGDPPVSLAQQLIALVGGNPDLQPQKAETWSVSVDVDVPNVSGLSVGLTYYDIHFKDQISLNTIFYTPATSPFWILHPTQEQAEAAVAQAQPYLGVPIDTLYTPAFGNGAYSILDFRRNNLSEVKQNGMDFNIRYITDTRYGNFLASLAGTYTFQRDQKPGPGQDFVNVLDAPGQSDLMSVLSFGWQRGGFSATANWNHTEGYDLDPVITTETFGNQSSVNAFDTVDLFLRYDLNGEGWTKDTSLTLNVENVFDDDPPFYSGTELGALPGFTNGNTLGRMAIFGIRKKF